MKNKRRSIRTPAIPKQESDSRPPASSESQTYYRITATHFPKNARHSALPVSMNDQVRVEKTTEPISKLNKNRTMAGRIETAPKPQPLSVRAAELWQQREHLPVGKWLKLLAQYPTAKREIDERLYKPVIDVLPHSSHEVILTEEEYETRYQKDLVELAKQLATEKDEQESTELLFFFLKYYGLRLLAEPSILPLVQGWWFAQWQDEHARKNLQEICDILVERGAGRPEELDENTKRKAKAQATARSKAVSRWLAKFGRYKEQLGSTEASKKQILMEFGDSTRIKDPHQKNLILQELRRRLRSKKVQK